MADVAIESPFPIYALPRAWAWMEQSRRQVADDFAPGTLAEFVSFWQLRERAGMRSWAVLRDRELGGVVTSMRFTPVQADAHCVFKRAFWGHETTAEALRLVFADLFADGVEKITTLCFADSHALLGLVARLGFRREGLLEKNTLRDGVLVDQVVIGLTKERFDEFIVGTGSADGAVLQQSGEPHDDHERDGHDVDQRDVHVVAEPDARANGAVGAAVLDAGEPDDAARSGGSGGAVHRGVDGRDKLHLQRPGKHAQKPVPIDRERPER